MNNILLMGLPKSGKTSILRVVFQKMSPHETFFLEQTQVMEVHDINNNQYVQFTIKDFPGNQELSVNNPQDVKTIKSCGQLIYVINAQEPEYDQTCLRLRDLIKTCYEINKDMTYEVFIHKVDSDMFLTEDMKMDTLNNIQNEIRGMLSEIQLNVSISFQLTSIYDHTIYEALSKVIQKLLPQVSYISILLDNLISTSKIQKAYLFDVISKIYIADDGGPSEMKHYEICSELIDVLIDVTCIYGVDNGGGALKFDNKSSSVIRLNHPGLEQNIVLYLREVDKCLALVCLINEEDFNRQHIINYNIDRFKEGLKKIFNASVKAQKHDPSQQQIIVQQTNQ